MRVVFSVVFLGLFVGAPARAQDELGRIFARMYRESHPPQPRYRALQDGAPKPQIRQLRRKVGGLMRILRGYSFLSQMGGDWANYQMARKISRFKAAATAIERDYDLRGRNWVAGKEWSRWQFLCKAITQANWQITNPNAAPSVSQQQKVETAAGALSRALHMIRYKELRPWADSARVDRTVHRVLWAPAAPPPPPGPGVVIVDNSRVDNSRTRVHQSSVSNTTVNTTVNRTSVNKTVVAPTVIAPTVAVQKQRVNAGPGSIVTAGQGLVQ
jgi:hypothetical protein